MCACSTGSVDVVKHTLHIMNADAAQCQFNTIHNTLSCDGTPIGFAISRGYTPLEFAISRGYTSIVEELLRTGIRVDMRHGGNALITAVEKGRSDFVKMLLEAPSVDACADADNIRDAICSSSIFGDSDMTGLLVLAFVSYRVKGLVDNGRGSEMSAIEIYRYACDI
jgi:ankyrin repeat protein